MVVVGEITSAGVGGTAAIGDAMGMAGIANDAKGNREAT